MTNFTHINHFRDLAKAGLDHQNEDYMEILGVSEEDYTNANSEYDFTALDRVQTALCISAGITSVTGSCLALGVLKGNFKDAEKYTTKSSVTELLLNNLDDAGMIALLYAGFLEQSNFNDKAQRLSELEKALDEAIKQANAEEAAEAK